MPNVTAGNSAENDYDNNNEIDSKLSPEATTSTIKKVKTTSPYSSDFDIMNWLKDTKDAGAPVVGQSLIGEGQINQ